MPTPLLDALYCGYLGGTAAMRATFSDESLLQKWLDVEAALAIAEGALGVIPQTAAEEIALKACAEKLSIETIMAEMARAVHPTYPVIKALEQACDGDAGQYVHWGATTQDIMDTANALQLKEAADEIERLLGHLSRVLGGLAERHKDTPMAGRTHGQHAVPITFGLKVAVWLSEIQRHQERLSEGRKRFLLGQFSGAAATLATLPDQGLEVQKAMLEGLGLEVPDVAWHVARDGIVEWSMLMSFVAGTCGKIAHEVIQLQKTEVGELEEPHNAGKIGSSTMPHKRNPMLCEAIMGLSQLVRGSMSTAVFGLVHQHERDMGPWQAEWQYVPEMTCAASGALSLTIRVLEGLVVNEARMLENLGLTHGMICSESIMIRLAETMGRQHAHDLVYESSMEAHDTGRTLAEVLAERGVVGVEELFLPESYLGHSAAFVDRVIARGKSL